MESGLSWADQWDYNTPDPPPQSSSNKDDKRGKGGKKKKKKSFGKKVLSLAWMKDIQSIVNQVRILLNNIPSGVVLSLPSTN
ncbi:hypothetical protein Peur_055830 [Populus x canadensis]